RLKTMPTFSASASRVASLPLLDQFFALEPLLAGERGERACLVQAHTRVGFHLGGEVPSRGSGRHIHPGFHPEIPDQHGAVPTPAKATLPMATPAGYMCAAG